MVTMTTATDIVAYTYRADLFCPPCVRHEVRRVAEYAPGDMDAEEYLDFTAKVRGIDRQDETSFDSDDFPKAVFHDQLQAGDACGCCGDYLCEPIDDSILDEDLDDTPEPMDEDEYRIVGLFSLASLYTSIVQFFAYDGAGEAFIVHAESGPAQDILAALYDGDEPVAVVPDHMLLRAPKDSTPFVVTTDEAL